MVHRMESVKKTCRRKCPVAVKTEFEDSGDDDVKLCSLSKRAKFNFSDQGCNPMEEASPLGLNLKKSESFLDLIEKNLSQEKSEPSRRTLTRKEKNASANGGDKLKASNFPASLLKIGTWEYKSRYEGDLVAKCYFAKHKLVWEVLDGGLKNKIEIQWSDIMAIKANYPDNALETLDLVLARQPLFFREINPQPRKHTLWQATSDFTSGQATIFRRHFLEFPQGTLEKHFEKLMQCDNRLRHLSQQPEIVLDTLYFQPMVSIFGDHNHLLDWKTEMASSFQGFRDTISTSGFSSSDIENQDPVGTPSEHTSRRSAPFQDILRVEGNPISSNKINETESLTLLNQVKLPGLRQSMSVGDFITHIGDCISEHMKSDDPDLHIYEDQRKDILDELSHYLLSDSQTTNTPVSDEKYIMSRVNSLCCLLQTGTQNHPIKPENPLELSFGHYAQNNKFNSIGESLSDEKTGLSFPRSDSVGEFLLQLPKIASLPRFLVNEGRE